MNEVRCDAAGSDEEFPADVNIVVVMPPVGQFVNHRGITMEGEDHRSDPGGAKDRSPSCRCGNRASGRPDRRHRTGFGHSVAQQSLGVRPLTLLTLPVGARFAFSLISRIPGVLTPPLASCRVHSSNAAGTSSSLLMGRLAISAPSVCGNKMAMSMPAISFAIGGVIFWAGYSSRCWEDQRRESYPVPSLRLRGGRCPKIKIVPMQRSAAVAFKHCCTLASFSSSPTSRRSKSHRRSSRTSGPLRRSEWPSLPASIRRPAKFMKRVAKQ
jgi:hypothetical protein